jgi:hypothetical protein
MRVNKNRKFNKVCPEFVSQFREDLRDGWSIGYACRTVPNELCAVKRAFNEFPELKELYDDYMSKKTQRHFCIRKRF